MEMIQNPQYPLDVPLLKADTHHLAVQSILAGRTNGQVYLDPAGLSRCALAHYRGRYFLHGDPAAPGVEYLMRSFFVERVTKFYREKGYWGFVLSYSPDGWVPVLQKALEGLRAEPVARQTYELNAPPASQPGPLPDGFRLELVSPALLDTLETGRDDLEDEMGSERDSPAEFLEKSFGFVLLDGHKLAGWCLSEYNLDGRCEIGIATLEPYQRRGFAVHMTQVFAHYAFANGCTRLGWHCAGENVASAKTAQKAGFRLAHEEQVLVVAV